MTAAAFQSAPVIADGRTLRSQLIVLHVPIPSAARTPRAPCTGLLLSLGLKEKSPFTSIVYKVREPLEGALAALWVRVLILNAQHRLDDFTEPVAHQNPWL